MWHVLMIEWNKNLHKLDPNHMDDDCRSKLEIKWLEEYKEAIASL